MSNLSSLEGTLKKVTGLVTRDSSAGPELLLLRHPFAGIQIPAGTVEEGETYEAAVLREVFEETGVSAVCLKKDIGFMESQAAPGHAWVLRTTKVYARPDVTSFDWAMLPRGAAVSIEKEEGSFIHTAYEEWDRFPDPTWITYKILGWVPRDALCNRSRRHFLHLVLEPGNTPDRWEHLGDNHMFELFWAPLNHLPEIVWPQNEWMTYISGTLGYDFK